MSHFVDARHNLYVGWVLGFVHRNGLTVAPGYDEAGNYTDRIILMVGGRPILLAVPEPPDDWTMDDDPPVHCPACGATATVQAEVWFETAHEPDCAWLADPESEAYS